MIVTLGDLGRNGKKAGLLRPALGPSSLMLCLYRLQCARHLIVSSSHRVRFTQLVPGEAELGIRNAARPALGVLAGLAAHFSGVGMPIAGRDFRREGRRGPVPEARAVPCIKMEKMGIRVPRVRDSDPVRSGLAPAHGVGVPNPWHPEPYE